MTITTAKLLQQLQATPQAPRALQAPPPQPVPMDDLAEQLTAPGWLDRDHARRVVLARRQGTGGPWLTRAERRQAQKILERQQRGQDQG
jgi:hypothetical protein